MGQAPSSAAVLGLLSAVARRGDTGLVDECYSLLRGAHASVDMFNGVLEVCGCSLS